MEISVFSQASTSQNPCDLNEEFDQYVPPPTKIPFDVNNEYNVFLSFRGKDVRTTFVDHLYGCLSAAGLLVFLDSEELEKGKEIESSLETAIQSSDIFIPIFSRHYAESTWCLKEAALMCRCNGFIIPLFYDVEPCDVRYPQRKGGPFEEAFKKHYSHLERQDKDTIDEWKNALYHISSLSGWARADEFEYEGRLVRRVVKDVLNTLKSTPLDVPVHVVGFEEGIGKLREDVGDLFFSLDMLSAEGFMTARIMRVGISGIGGIGKTTLAKLFYNILYEGRGNAAFEGYCFAQKNTSLVDLQRKILRGLVNYQGEVSTLDEGKYLMKKLLRGIRALVILDNVNDRSHLEAVNGDWFGPGSRIIITSRDNHILNLAEVDSVIHMTGLEDHNALELFSWHAFSRAFPDTPYKDLSTRIARACKGNPLALQVIGAHLFDKKLPNDIQCWEEALHNIGENQEISSVLRISYDGLSHVEKKIFLDIACLFAGELKDNAIAYWEVLYPNRVYTVLTNLFLKMLINDSIPQDRLDMNELLRGMGRGIQDQLDDNSRLMAATAHRTLSRDRAEAVNMLVYTGENAREPVSFQRMPSLRYLVVQNTKVAGNIANFAPDLVWIKIRNCEFVTDTYYSWLTLRDRFQLDSNWSQVRILSVEQCATLTRIPKTIDSLVNLQYLYVKDCASLTSLPNSFGNLAQLKELKLDCCTSLTSLPHTVGKLMLLDTLHLRGCTGLTSLPITLGNLAHLQNLFLENCTGLRNLPHTIDFLTELHLLFIHDCSGLRNLPYPFGKLQNLKVLYLDGPDRAQDLGNFHNGVVKLAELRELNRSGLGSLEEKKFNVYFVYHSADGEEMLMGDKYKDLRTGSLGVCNGGEGGKSGNFKEAIDSSDIFVPVLSKSFAESTVCVRKYIAMLRAEGLVIPLNHYNYTYFYCFKLWDTIRELQ